MRHHSNHVCGCYFVVANKHTYLPQVKLDSHTTITPVSFATTLTQVFRNPNKEQISQARYTFPLYDGVAVAGYTISYGDKALHGIVKQKEEAKKTYQAAIDRGETAGLLDALPAGVFGVTLGNLPPETDVTVQIDYCGELKHDAAIDGLRYILPTSIAPRYGSYPGDVLSRNTVNTDGMRITVDIDMGRKTNIRRVQSPSHPIAVSMGEISTTSSNAPGNDFNPSHASATLTQGTAELSGDFVLQLIIDDIASPRAIVETHPTLPNQRCIMTTLVPKFTLQPAHPEIVFLADQSGSMGGSKNTALVAALKVFLKSLPLGVRFNVAAFGSNFDFLWPSSQAYNEGNLKTAVEFVESFAAHYGGTEILRPIRAAFEKRLQDLPLEVMLLTDGEIWGEDALFSYINEQVHDKAVDARVFALGIGQDVSHTLVEGVARAGNGFAQFVTQDEDTDQKVMRMLKGALYAHTKDYELEVHYKDDEKMVESEEDEGFEIVEKVKDCLVIDDGGEKVEDQVPAKAAKSFFDSSVDIDKPAEKDGDRYAHLPKVDTPSVLQAPATIPPLFPFNRTTAYLILGPESAQKTVTSITLRATSAEGPLELNVPILGTQSGTSIHQLAARKAIQDLEEGRGWLHAATVKGHDTVSAKEKYKSRFDEIVEREAVRLGEQFQVASKWTSFVAVEDHSNKAIEPAEDTREQPLGVRASSRMRPTVTNMSPAQPSGRSGFGLFGSSSGGNSGSGLFGSSSGGSPSMSHSGARFTSATPAHYAMQQPPMAQAACCPLPNADDLSDEDMGFALIDDFTPAPPPPAPAPVSEKKRRTGASARQSTGGKAPRRQLASMAARKSAPNNTVIARDEMHQIIDLQTFSGAWGKSDDLFELMGLEHSAVDVSKLGGDDDIAATALAIAYLQTKLSGKKDAWEMVVEKARYWLVQRLGDESQVDHVIAAAVALF